MNKFNFLSFRSKYSVLDNFSDGIIILNKRNEIKYCNNAIIKIFKCKSDEINNIILSIIKESHGSEKNIFKTKDQNNKILYIRIQYSSIVINFKSYTLVNIYDKTKEELEYIEYHNSLKKSEEILKTGTFQLNTLTDELTYSNGVENIYESSLKLTYNLIRLYTHVEDKDLFLKNIHNYNISDNQFEFIYRINVNKKLKYIYCICKYKTQNHLDFFIQDVTKQQIINLNLIDAKLRSKYESEMKTSFVANISHEIRTPINGIIGMANLLKDTELSIEQENALNIITESSGLLLSIINNVLDFTKIESGKMDIEYIKVDLYLLLNNIEITFNAMLLSNKNIKLYLYIEQDVPNIILSDPIKLRQILYNLLSNAIKFTEFGSIIINVKKQKTFINFEVKDTGIGIQSNLIHNLFRPFVQIDNSITKNYSGTGLGLSICKSLVSLFNGTISIKSSLGIGTLINFSIPLLQKTNKETKITFKDENNKNKEGKLIIIVEDNNINQIVLKKTLEKIKYTNYIIYDNGKSLIDNIDVLSDASLILMDIHMPIMDGYICTKIIREKNITCPIIALTANAMTGEKEKCIDIGMNDFILKPIHMENFKIIIDKWTNI